MNRPRFRLWPAWLCSAVVLVIFVACSGVPLDETHLQECACGTPEADTLGCAAVCMLEGPGACENPLCTCEADPDYVGADKGGRP